MSVWELYMHILYGQWLPTMGPHRVKGNRVRMESCTDKLVYIKIGVPDSLLRILTCTSKSPNSEALPKHWPNKCSIFCHKPSAFEKALSLLVSQSGKHTISHLCLLFHLEKAFRDVTSKAWKTKTLLNKLLYLETLKDIRLCSQPFINPSLSFAAEYTVG